MRIDINYGNLKVKYNKKNFTGALTLDVNYGNLKVKYN